MHNACASVASGEISMWAADDISFVTYGCDVEIIIQFEKWSDGLGLIFPDDLSTYKGRHATHAFVKREWLRAFGSLVPPYLPDAYTDNWITYLATAIGRIPYLENLIVEHLQYRQDITKHDETYETRARNTQIRNHKATFRRLYSEKCTEIIVFCFKYNLKIPFNLLSWVVFAKSNKASDKAKIKLSSTPNHDFIGILFSRLLMKFRATH
jgi:hypothetical protein